MGVHRPDVLYLRPRHPQQAVLDLDDLLPHDIILILLEQVIYLADDPCRGILDGKHSKVRAALIDGIHGVPEAVHMEAVDALPEILRHGRLGVGSLRPLEHHPGLSHIQRVHADERQLLQPPVLHEKPILELPAHGHNLLEQLHHAEAIELIAGQGAHLLQLLGLPALVQDILPRGYLVLRHLPADVHALLEQFHHLRVYGIDALSQFCQIHICDSFVLGFLSFFFLNFHLIFYLIPKQS